VARSGVDLPRPLEGELRPVLIYGVGEEGRTILSALRRSPNLTAVGFVDPDPSLWRQYIDGLRVYSPAQLPQAVNSLQVKQVLLATRQASRKERLDALRALEGCPAEIRMLPAVEDIATGHVSINDLRPVKPEDLLGRPAIPPDPDLMSRAIAG